jgi:hypothetical protein
MQSFFVAAADSIKPMFFGFLNPLSVLLRQQGNGQPAADAMYTRRELEVMATEAERFQPGLAAEIRSFSARN